MEFNDPAFHILLEDELVIISVFGKWNQADAVRYSETLVTLSQYVPYELVVISDVTAWDLPLINEAIIINHAHKRVFKSNRIVHLGVLCASQNRKKYAVYIENLTLKHIKTPFALLTSGAEVRLWLESVNTKLGTLISQRLDEIDKTLVPFN